MEKEIRFNSYDGTSLVGLISLSECNTENAILLIHGLPSNKDEWGFYKDMSEFLNQHNVKTFRFDFRYNGESEKGNLSELTLSEMINDIESAYWVLRNEVGNDVKISIVGTSCGGGVSVKWFNTFKRSISKIFLMAPVLDYEYEVTGARKSDNMEHYMLSSGILENLSKNKVLNNDVGYGYQMINEAHQFNIKKEFLNCTIPIIIFQGNEDSIVPIGITNESIQGFSNIELIEINKANHGFAVAGDEDLTAKGTKDNHYFVYNELLKRI